MSDVLIIHHSLDTSSARLLAKALARLGFASPTLCDERGGAGFPDALAAGRVAIAIWSHAASGSAGFAGLAAIADAAGKLLSLRGPDGAPAPTFGRAFLLAGWDGSDLRHPGILELARTLSGRYRARRAREAPHIAVSAFGVEPPLHAGPASARLRPRPPAPSVSGAAHAALRQEGDVAVLAAPRPQAAPSPEIRRTRVIIRPTPDSAPAPAPPIAPRKKKKRRAPSVVAWHSAFAALCAAFGALVVAEMASAPQAAAPVAAIALARPAPVIQAQPIAEEIALVEAASPSPPALERFAVVETFDAPAPFAPLAPVDLALTVVRDEAPVEKVSWRVVARQYVW